MAHKLSGTLTTGGKMTPAGRIFLRVMAAVFVVSALSSIRHEARIFLGAEHSEAKVVAVRMPDDRSGVYQTDIHFTTLDGAPVNTTITLPISKRIPLASEGETFPVMYAPENTRDAVPLGRHAVSPTALIFTAVGILCGWISRL